MTMRFLLTHVGGLATSATRLLATSLEIVYRRYQARTLRGIHRAAA
jgi:hypothetical protein